MSEPLTIEIGPSAKVRIWRDGEWTILHVIDGSGSQTTLSLPVGKALDIAMLLRGHAIKAGLAPPLLAKESQSGR